MSLLRVSDGSGISSSPWLMLPPAFEGQGEGGGDMVYKFYSLAEERVLCINKRGGDDSAEQEEEELPDDEAELVGSSHGWLALFNRRNCALFLSNPISRRHIKLPPIHTLSIPEGNLEDGTGCVSKVIISCSPDDGEQECRAVMSFGPEDRLAFCWPGRSTEWTPIGALYYYAWFSYTRSDGTRARDRDARVYEDFVYSSRHKLLFCITEESNELECWDLGDPMSPRMDWLDKKLFKRSYSRWATRGWAKDRGLKEYWCRQVRCLVFAEQSNQLFLLTRHIAEEMRTDSSIVVEEDDDYGGGYPYKTVGFDVHKIDRDESGKTKLSYMEGSLDGLAMFVGLNHSFAMSAAEFPELKPNSIYFTDARQLTPPKWDEEPSYGGHDVGIFDYGDRTLSPCYYPCDVQSITRIVPAPMWFAQTPSPSPRH